MINRRWRIGIDLDNTIVCLDPVFTKVASELGLGDFNGCDKVTVKAILTGIGERKGKESGKGSVLWQALQGQVYSSYYHLAKPFSGSLDSVKCWIASGIADIFIVSHKTRVGHQDEKKTSLHDVAFKWLETSGFIGDLLIPPGQVYFEETQELKVSRISDLGCDIFIDDLPELLMRHDFPCEVVPLLFDPGNHYSYSDFPGARFFEWKQMELFVSRYLRGCLQNNVD